VEWERYPEPLRPHVVTSRPDAVVLRELLDKGWFAEENQTTAVAGLLRVLQERDWDADARAELLRALAAAVDTGRIDRADIGRPKTAELVAASDVGDCFAVVECLATLPPPHMEITKMLSKGGHEKLAFLAKSSTRLSPIVLKRFRDPKNATDVAIAYETTPREHPNIVSTEEFWNTASEPFFTEEYMDEVLDREKSKLFGYVEPANLLFDMASALLYLHNALRRIHGDIKPDNIARKGSRYVLLDFGNSTPLGTDPTPVPPAGLRARPPELLSDPEVFTTDPRAADVWSLGATLFFLLVGRYPLLEHGETPLPGSRDEKREALKQRMRERAEQDYDRLVEVDADPIEPELRPLLRAMLERQPGHRITANALVEKAERALAPYLRSERTLNRLSPDDELAILDRHVSEALQYEASSSWLSHCRGEMVRMRWLPGWTDSERQAIESLIGRLETRLAELRR
jgi:serine/threonine protein kinase